MAKILHRFYDLYAGGAEVVVLNMVRALPDHQHVLVFTNYRPTWLAAELRRSPTVTLVWVPDRDLRDVLIRESPDSIIFHYYPPMMVADLVTVPDSMAARTTLYNHWHGPVPFVPAITRYCFPSHSSATRCGMDIPDPYKEVIVNPVSDQFFDIQRRIDHVFRVGRHSRGIAMKFSPDFFDLFERIDIVDLHVLSLGHTPEMATWLASHAFDFKHTYWLITGNTMDVAEFLTWIDVYVYKTHPSFTETCPVSILEALASGIPVVAEGRGGITDLVVHGETGYLCHDQADYVTAVKELHADVDLRRRYSLAAREWARSYASIKRFRHQIATWLGL